MPDLPNPESRVEQYLANLTDGTTEIPKEPESRIEQYLDYLTKNGTVNYGTAPAAAAGMALVAKTIVDGKVTEWEFGDAGGLKIHICTSSEYGQVSREPVISSPDEKTLYLVPAENGSSPDLFVEWAYVNNNWEMFGSASIGSIPDSVNEWLTEHITNPDSPPLDRSLTSSSAAAPADLVGEELTNLKQDLSDIGDKVGSVSETKITDYTLTANKYISAQTGGIVDQNNYSVTNYIEVTPGQTVYSRSLSDGYSPYGRVAVYDENYNYAGKQNGITTTTQYFFVVPDDGKYIAFSGMTSRFSNIEVIISTRILGSIETDILDLQTDVSGLSDSVETLANRKVSLLKKYMKDAPCKPLLAEMMADFAWCSMPIPNAFTGKNVVITVSGSAESDQLTASAISPSGLSVSDIGSDWVGGVLSADGVNYTICNFKYVSENTIKIYPALTESITDGTLSTLMYDSGASYVGLHLTENGYKAYMQNLYAKNPKHCEVGKYIARFRPEIDTTSPFTWYGGTIPAAQYRFITANKNQKWLQNPTKKFYGYQYSTSWTAHTTKSGAYWDVDLKGKSGYMEAYVFAICKDLKLPQDQELHVIVTIDGVEKLNQIISDSICRRIVVDYENATSGRLEVYSNKWYKVNNAAYGFGFGRVTWWVNDLEYDLPLFPKGAVIAQEFDSWGVFHDGASGDELERLHNVATGITVPFTNESKGDQTSAWGLAYYYVKVWQNHPSISIHDFVINDTNSVGNAGIPATIEGPDGTEYNNKLTSSQYADNMKLLAQLAISNRIQPIFMRACQHGSTDYYTFTNALIDALSEEIE